MKAGTAGKLCHGITSEFGAPNAAESLPEGKTFPRLFLRREGGFAGAGAGVEYARGFLAEEKAALIVGVRPVGGLYHLSQ